MGLTSIKMEIYKTRDRIKTFLEGDSGRHSLVGNYLDCVGNCADYLVVPKKVRRATFKQRWLSAACVGSRWGMSVIRREIIL